MAQKLNNFEKPDFYTVLKLDALDCLTIGLVAYKYTKLGKTSENLILSQGMSYIRIPLCYLPQLCHDKMRNLMKTNDLRQFPSPTGSRELNAPHGGL